MVLSIRWAGRPAVRPSGLPNEVFPVLSGSSTTHLVSAHGAPALLIHLGAGALAVVGVIERPVAKLVDVRTWLRRRPASPDESESAQKPKTKRRERCSSRTGPLPRRARSPDPSHAPAQSRARDRRPDVAGLAPSRPTRSGGWPNSSSGFDPQRCGSSSPRPVPPPTRDGLRQVVLAASGVQEV